jgi:molybdopterin molybdotransferase
MLSWEEARQKVLDGVTKLPPEERPVGDAMGLALAEDVRAPEAMPPFDNSAMDGFAVRVEDVNTASPENPVTLEVVAQRPAGTSDAARVGPGQAIRIMTGAPIPDGADAVVMVEATNFWNPEIRRARPPEAGESSVEIGKAVVPGTNIRPRGESVEPGSVVLESGHRIEGAELGLLLSVGVHRVRVHPLPRVAVLSTGDELVLPDREPGPGQIRDSNRPALLAVLESHGFPVLDLGLSGDNASVLATRIGKGAAESDFLLTSGGVSVGDLDLTREVLDQMGRVEAYQVAVKPGKPQVFGHLGDTPVFGLPGNPVSSLVVFEQFVLPALKKMAGRRNLFLPHFTARLATPVVRKRGRVEFMRVRLSVENGEWVAHSAGAQGSGVLSSMTGANGYAILPEDAERLGPGTSVPCQLRDWN